MSSTQQRAIALISKPPQQRVTQEIDLLLPWLKKKSQLFESLEKHVIIDIVRNCRYERVYRDHVIIRQGDAGDCFYIILNGTVSVFIDARKSGEDDTAETQQKPAEQINEPKKDEASSDENPEKKINVEILPNIPAAITEEEPPTKKPLDRSKYGKYVIKFESGRSFGEIALISEDSVRNASIIADEETDLLVIHRDLYNETLKTFQQKEYQDRREFVTGHPLFRQWLPRFQRLMEMSLIKETLTYDTPIIRQGDPVNGLIFITKGRAKVQVAPSRHAQQYPDMKPFKSSNNVYEIELNRSSKSDCEKKKKRSRQSLKQELVAVRRNQGYAAAEKKMFFKNVDLCSVEAGEVIGDIETIMGMETHLETVVCVAQTELYYLTSKNYERLITKKNPTTVDVLRRLVERKLESRVRSRQGSQIPLLKHILFKLTQERKPQKKKMPPLRISKELPERDTLFNHLLSAFVQNKAELIEPYVPGSIYYREIMREKARIRDNVRRHSNRKEQGAMLKRSLKQNQKPRTIVALRNDLQRQMVQQRELEYKWLLEELRAEEKLLLMQEFQRYKPLPEIDESVESGSVEPTPREEEPVVRLTTAERLAAEKLAAAEANGETSRQYGVFEMPIIRDRHSVTVNVLNVAREKDTAEQIKEEVEESEIGGESDYRSNSINSSRDTEDATRITTGKDRMETVSNPETSLHRSDRSRRGTESAYAMILPAPGHNAILVTEVLSPQLKGPYRGFQGSTRSLDNFGTESYASSEGSSNMNIISPFGRSGLHLNYENPEYRDWETSEKTLSYLEERIKNFNVSDRRELTPIKLQKLARFEKGDEQTNQPRPGGKVLIRRRMCPIIGHQYKMPNHSHTKYRILPRIPNYDQMKKAKMLAHMTLDEQRHQRLSQSEPYLNGIL